MSGSSGIARILLAFRLEGTRLPAALPAPCRDLVDPCFIRPPDTVDARAEPQTVCTITVNSPDEQATFRRYLPPERFTFVELVERGRPDWLESARRAGIRS